jgi:NCAIR mutase (PurE)-related protein
VDVDERRYLRTGVAEAIFAPGKTPHEIAYVARRLEAARREAGAAGEWPILATRISPEIVVKVEWELAQGEGEAHLAYDAEGSVLELFVPKERPPLGPAAVISAGTTDREAAAEAATVLRAYGADVSRFDDCGIAGLHRLLDPPKLQALESARVVLVVAGMDGALPAVVAGLVRAPVIGVPSPVGYGVAEGGRAALQTMLASCAPGLAVVNIGNGFGAAALAVKILRGSRQD